MSAYDVVVVGSGAGGGLMTARLASAGARVLLVEAGGDRRAEEFTRFELKAYHDLWWPPQLTTSRDPAEQVALLAGRTVGGTTVINTRVAMRADEEDVAKWPAATGLRSADGGPFTLADLTPAYDVVERELGVRERGDWTASTAQLAEGLRAIGASLEPVRSYTDHNCGRCGSCLQGCPTNAGKSAENVWVRPAVASGNVTLQAHTEVRRLVIEPGGDRGHRVTGVEWDDDTGATGRAVAPTVVLAAGALQSPRLLLRSMPETGSPSRSLVGQTLGLHPARLVYGLMSEAQDAFEVYPISGHCLDFRAESAGGVVLEGSTIQDPVAFARSLVDDAGRPLWGAALREVTDDYRRWNGVLVMATDDNTGRLVGGPDHSWHKEFSARERNRLELGLDVAREALLAAGASRVVWTGLSTSHVQGTLQMGGDPNRSVVDERGECWDVGGLYAADGSVVPASLSSNPSLTIMALAHRVATGLTSPA